MYYKIFSLEKQNCFMVIIFYQFIEAGWVAIDICPIFLVLFKQQKIEKMMKLI